MKLNKIEKIIVVVILLGLILVGGAFIFVVPSFQQIDKNGKTLATNLQEKADLDSRLSRLDTIDGDIETEKSNARKAEGGFYPDLTTYETSELAMAYLKSANLEAHEITIDKIATKDLTLEYFLPIEVEYDLKENAAAANINADEEVIEEGTFTDGGKKYSISISSITNVVITDENGAEIAPSKYSETMKKVYKAAVCRAAAADKVSQTVAYTQATYKVKGKYGDYVKFIDHIYDLERATVFDKVIYPATVTINEDKDSNAVYISEDGTIAQGSEANGKETMVTDDTVIEEDITIIFLCAEPMESVKNLDADGTKIVVDQRPTIY